MSEKPRVQVVEGWFVADPARPRLVGTRCAACGAIFFPRETTRCRNPRCGKSELVRHELSHEGTLWSFTNSCYQPPEPYLAADPFVPFVIAAVELAAEKMVVLGQVVRGVEIAELVVGMPMELTVGALHEDDARQLVTWNWRPQAAAARRAS